MALAQQPPERLVRITGLVENVNERGIKIDGQWANFSRFANVARPPQGALVALQVRGGWIQTLEVVDSETGANNCAGFARRHPCELHRNVALNLQRYVAVQVPAGTESVASD